MAQLVGGDGSGGDADRKEEMMTGRGADNQSAASQTESTTMSDGQILCAVRIH